MDDSSFPFPPDLIGLLKQCTPILVKGKRDLINFFRASGVSEKTLSPLEAQVIHDRNSINKYAIAETIIIAMNQDKSNAGISSRRRLLQRVIQFKTFANCYPEKEAEARGLISAIRDLVNENDTITKLNDERLRERQKHLAASEEAAEAKRAYAEKRYQLRRNLASLFTMTDTHRRGKLLETVLNRLFALDGNLIREAFSIVSDHGEGILEQIDGVIEIDYQKYLVEMKWYAGKVGPDEVSKHMVSVFERAQTRGIFISANGFTASAIDRVTVSLSKATFVLCTLEEVVRILDDGTTVSEWLRPKITAAQLDRKPLVPYVAG